VKWSSGTNWRDIVVEAHDITALETPDFEVPDHVLALHLEHPSSVDLHIDGRHHRDIHEPGHMTLFPAGVSRRVRTLESHGVLFIALSPKLLVQAGLEMREAPAVQLAEQFRFTDPQCEHIACALKAEAESNYPSGALYGETLAMGLAARLRRAYATANDSAAVYKGGMAPQVMRRVLDFIHDNLSDELRMESLAAVAGLSHYRFAHNFKLAEGIAPHQYVIRVRMERGKQMLRDTDHSIAEIALAVGCQSSSHFTRLFRRATGVTPTEYRAAFR
jgi:AraC family transcriptional regulator